MSAGYGEHMIKREDFMFTVGYEGSTAIVDGKAKKQFGSLSVDDLIDQGQYKAAFCAALYDQDEEAMRKVRESYNSLTGSEYENSDQMRRLLGVDRVRDDIAKSKSV